MSQTNNAETTVTTTIQEPTVTSQEPTVTSKSRKPRTTISDLRTVIAERDSRIAELEAALAAYSSRYIRDGRDRYLAVPLTEAETATVSQPLEDTCSRQFGEGELVSPARWEGATRCCGTWQQVVEPRWGDVLLPQFRLYLARYDYSEDNGTHGHQFWGLIPVQPKAAPQHTEPQGVNVEPLVAERMATMAAQPITETTTEPSDEDWGPSEPPLTAAERETVSDHNVEQTLVAISAAKAMVQQPAERKPDAHVQATLDAKAAAKALIAEGGVAPYTTDVRTLRALCKAAGVRGSTLDFGTTMQATLINRGLMAAK
jgi:hypothetical protein